MLYLFSWFLVVVCVAGFIALVVQKRPVKDPAWRVFLAVLNVGLESITRSLGWVAITRIFYVTGIAVAIWLVCDLYVTWRSKRLT